MKIVLIVVGVIFFSIGAIDLVGSFTGFDLWGGFFGIQLPELLWKYSAYLELLVGYLAFKAGRSIQSSGEVEAENA